MPRIRSIHPGFWTDEDVVAISRDARLFFIGLWGQCDDKGAFEWKPRSLKMRLFPADDDIAIDTLLRTLVRADLVRSYTVEGRKFGVVRNFQKFQRPKKPNDLFPLPQELRDYVSGTGSEPVGKSRAEGVGVVGGKRNPPRRPRRKPPVVATVIRSGFAASVLNDLADTERVVPIPRKGVAQ